MRRVSVLASAALLGFALTSAASAAPAPQDVLRGAQAQAYPSEAFSQHRHYGHRHHAPRYHAAPRYHGHRHYGHRHYRRNGGAVAAGVAGGLALGLLGAAIAAQPGPAVAGGPGWYDYCARRFGPTFDPRSGTYLGADGYRHPCR
ncbi:BA14K family protein [Enterovirga rhinocerotis]|uniref:Lectin-like protein BA14k n=1 Tax=Enterovirga rhinocerotis TaxID=1339210 RepID=A0A4R7BUT6_9HYPH|nr:BA14K family protein [Enterovirga rhinocerotis]TDR89261.1 BA14K-like protein [Enterovirga rhinocerotis]